MVDQIFVLAVGGVIFGGLVIKFFEVGDGGAFSVVIEGLQGFGGECKLVVVDGVLLAELVVEGGDLVVEGHLVELFVGGQGVEQVGPLLKRCFDLH